jgi:hypothetical protein
MRAEVVGMILTAAGIQRPVAAEAAMPEIIPAAAGIQRPVAAEAATPETQPVPKRRREEERKFVQGQRIDALYEGVWIPAVVQRQQGKGVYVVWWVEDDPPTHSAVPVCDMRAR